MTVLALTHTKDNSCIDTVTAAVEARGGRVFRLDTNLFPTQVSLELSQDAEGDRGRLRSPTDEVELAEITAIWHRRLRIGQDLPEDMEGQFRGPSLKESRATLMGAVAALPVFVMDPMARIRHAEHKSNQLRLARDAGLDVPRTLTTNDPQAVRTFFERCDGEIITKMLSAWSIIEDGLEKVVFTNPVKEEELEALASLNLCPMTFQETLDKERELRVTVVGSRIFTASVDSQSMERSKVDWRREGAALTEHWSESSLSPEIERGILALMDALHLNYGALDFVVTTTGRTVFLEINPAGEFFWLEKTPGLPIADAMADVLLGLAPRRDGSMDPGHPSV